MKTSWLLTPILCLPIGVGCDRSQLEDLPLLVTTSPEAVINAWPLGGAIGQIVIDNNCVKLKHNLAAAPTVTLIFPPRYKLRRFKQGWAISTSQGDIWATVGDQRTVGGGEVKDQSQLSSLASFAVLDRCRGPFWRVTPESSYELRPRNVPPLPPPEVDR